MTATYRLQLQPGFGFAEVEGLLPYFQRLGVSHLYLSPITEARPGSTHGYDVIDHNAVRADFGGREGLDRLLEAAREAGLQFIFDFVPNHAGVGSNNASWQDVLAYGRHAPHASYFDVDWDPLKPELHGKILLPFLGQPYGEVLDADELGLGYEDGRFYAAYYDNRFALAPATYADVLAAVLPDLERTEAYWDAKDLQEAYTSLQPEELEKAETLALRLRRLADQADLGALVDDVGRDALHAILEQQRWRLSYWKTAGYEINYRRFFDINGLAGLRMEDPHVFWDAHRLLGELLAHEAVAGVRIDHIDGLFDPKGYLESLRDLGAKRVWVEKIFALGETLPESWPVEGATGYAFMNDAMGVLLRRAGEHGMDRVYRRFVPEAEAFDEVVYHSKVLVMETALSSELFRLAYELDRISEANYHTRDFTLEALREALAEVVAAFGRYRTYLPPESEEAEEEARAVVQEAIYKARQRNPATEPTVYAFLQRVILGDVRDNLREQQEAWTGRFQQYTAPVAAKGVEDTAFYRFLRLVALNEVGGEPDHFGQTAQAFHAHARFRAHRYPLNLLATATHDHKRGEDTRMRLIALAEMPDVWEGAVHDLAELALRHRGEAGPDRAAEYLFYQILAALWPDADKAELPDRLWTYMQKAARERKAQTSWINPDERYEAALERFVRGMLEDERLPDVLGRTSEQLARAGFHNGLSQVVLKFTTPGVPDVYQGTELPDLSLVDPDNRRDVDYAERHRLLDELDGLLQNPSAADVQAMIEDQDPRAKFYVTAQLLRLRNGRPAPFEGGYRALDVEEADVEEAEDVHWIAYAREAEGDGEALVVVVSRFPLTRPEDAAATIPLPDALAGRAWTDVLTGARLDAAPAISTAALPLPWAVLRSTE